jgi:hypothetical protein
MQNLPNGNYPFIDQLYPLSDMIMVEAPGELEKLFKAQASENGVEIIRDRPVELRCKSEEYPDATFLIFWPTHSERIHMLVPRGFAQGIS